MPAGAASVEKAAGRTPCFDSLAAEFSKAGVGVAEGYDMSSSYMKIGGKRQDSLRRFVSGAKGTHHKVACGASSQPKASGG